MSLPAEVTLFEVGPRDGLQNEKVFVDTADKIALINALSQTGLKHIEVTSFVSPKAIPQLADGEEVLANIDMHQDIQYAALIPNIKGLDRASGHRLDAVAVFTAASETFNQRNINASIEESLQRIQEVVTQAKAQKLFVRGYVSCVLGCPYEGNIQPTQVATVTRALLDMGVDEVSLGDTIGVGTPNQLNHLLDEVLPLLSPNQLAMHFHDTYGQALANIYASLLRGINRFDSSIAGLGGCPYARGASGNVATEDVLYMMHGLGIETGIDIYKVVKAGDDICKKINRVNQSKVANALLANCSD